MNVWHVIPLISCPFRAYGVQVKSKFSVDDQRHYIFSPRDLTAWVQGLLRYDCDSENLLDVVAHEAHRIFRDRLVDAESEAKMDSVLNALLRSQWKHTVNLQDSFFSTLHGSTGGGKENPLRIFSEKTKNVT